MTGSVLARRTAALLRLVASNAEPMGLSELSRASDIPQATCARILRALVDEELLEVDPETRRHRVSFALIAMMADQASADGSIELLRAEVERLSDTTSETAGIDLAVGDDVVVVLQVEGPLLISQTRAPVPRRLPLLTTSTGKAFLAWHDDPDYVERRLAGVVPTERRRLREDFTTSRARGYAVAWEELDPGAAAIAAPVVVDGRVACTTWIGGPTFRLTHERIPELAVHVVDAAARVATLLRTGRARLHDLSAEPASVAHTPV
jgi:DNA-binding IclR family transcriptional regulator